MQFDWLISVQYTFIFIFEKSGRNKRTRFEKVTLSEKVTQSKTFILGEWKNLIQNFRTSNWTLKKSDTKEFVVIPFQRKEEKNWKLDER